MRNHQTSVRAVPADTFEEADKANPTPGAFEVLEELGQAKKSLLYICPCGCGELRSIPIREGVKVERAWEWNGNLTVPTVKPSIRHLSGCRWHGFLENGMWNPCGDSGR